MVLNPFPISSPVQIQADWVELKCLSDLYNCVPLADVRSALEFQADEQDEDIGREDGEVESVIDAILNEIRERESNLTSSYPFQIELGGGVVSLTDSFEQLTIDQCVYIYCLVFSHISNSPILTPSQKANNSDRDIMQICATIAAAGYVRGHSISFGFPRPDNSNFYDKTQSVIGLLGEGELHAPDEINPIHSLSPKDAGIDVISWECMNDNRPGRRILFSQVASGNNWKEKPVKPYIETFKNYWLKHPILSTINDAMFIPFDMTDDIDNRYTAEQFLNSQLINLGTIFYRKRVPAYFKDGIKIGQQDGAIVERLNELDKIQNYVNDKVGLLKASAI
ncbi:TPA: hypothetical protein ACJCXE_001088 [Yersinia enterocolitica]|nr:hypothetical protein [Yersinia enterocolitica]